MLKITGHMDLACVISMKPQNDKIIILLTWSVVTETCSGFQSL